MWGSEAARTKPFLIKVSVARAAVLGKSQLELDINIQALG